MAEEQTPNEIAALLKTLPPDGPRSFEAIITPLVESAVKQAVPPVFDSILRRIGYSEEVAGLVHMFAARTNDAKEQVLSKALTLYGLALDAREKGNRLAIITPDDVIVHDIIGFETENPPIDRVAS